MNKAKTIVFWAVLVLSFVTLYTLNQNQVPLVQVELAEFLEDVQHGRVERVEVNSNELTVHLLNGNSSYTTLASVDDDLTKQLSENGVRIAWGQSKAGNWTPFLIVLVPLALLLGLLLFFLRRARSCGGGILELGKSRARTLSEECEVTFADVGGCLEAKDTLRDVVDFLKSPERWTNAGARLPRGVLLEGPPGCGKTLLARAVAGETNAKFFYISASEFVELYVGVGASRVRDMFETAVKDAPAVIFIDELDAVGRRRGSGVMPGHEEREQTLNQLLVCLDGFESNAQVVVIAATNRSDILDPALLRAGRFDHRIEIPELSHAERKVVLKIHTKSKPIGDDVTLEELANAARGFTGAQLESLANDAALQAVRRTRNSGDDSPAIQHEDFLAAIRKKAAILTSFNQVDSVLIDSATQLAQPGGKLVIRVGLEQNQFVEGELLWADASFLKLKPNEDEEIVLPKAQVRSILTLQGGGQVDARDIQRDAWACQQPQLA